MRSSSVIGKRPGVRTAPAWRRFAAPAALLIVSIGAIRTAWAQGSSLALTWQAPVQCPDEAFVPTLCLLCPDGGTGCGQFSCVDNQCVVTYCQ